VTLSSDAFSWRLLETTNRHGHGTASVIDYTLQRQQTYKSVNPPPQIYIYIYTSTNRNFSQVLQETGLTIRIRLMMAQYKGRNM
jgi:hypothetical protein